MAHKLRSMVSFPLRLAFAASISVIGAQVVRGQTPSKRAFPIGTDSFVSHYTRAPEGSEVHVFQRTDTGYRYIERTVIPRVMRREVVVDFDRSLRVLHAQSTGSIGDRPIRSFVVYDGRRARGSAQPLQAQSAAAVRIDTVLPVRAFDGLALYPVLLSRRWRIGDVDTLFLFDTDELSVTRQTARATRREPLTLSTGSIATLRVELSTTQLPVTLWLSEKAPHRLLKIASANGETIRVFTSVPSNER